MIYKNPWHNSEIGNPKIGDEYFDSTYCKHVATTPCGRGLVLRITTDHFDYLIDRKVVTQRVGNGGIELLNKFINIIDNNLTANFWDNRIIESYNKG